jgi:signal transduction histidine kinase
MPHTRSTAERLEALVVATSSLIGELALDLPLSRRLARLLGGELHALPAGDGEGGRFILEIPAAAES